MGGSADLTGSLSPETELHSLPCPYLSPPHIHFKTRCPEQTVNASPPCSNSIKKFKRANGRPRTKPLSVPCKYEVVMDSVLSSPQDPELHIFGERTGKPLCELSQPSLYWWVLRPKTNLVLESGKSFHFCWNDCSHPSFLMFFLYCALSHTFFGYPRSFPPVMLLTISVLLCELNSSVTAPTLMIIASTWPLLIEHQPALHIMYVGREQQKYHLRSPFLSVCLALHPWPTEGAAAIEFKMLVQLLPVHSLLH